MINYYLLTKPGIVIGNLITLAAGFALGSKHGFNFLLFLETFFGLALVMGSACAFNSFIDQDLDKQMKRTKMRPLARGIISRYAALFFAGSIGLFGFLILATFTNVLTVTLAAFGFLVYVLIYSFSKCRTVWATAIGSLAGATPPVIGYTAASNQLDVGAILLFAILFLWQMPHFFAIALMHLEDYTRAGVPLLPVVKGVNRTKVHMLLYVLAFIPATILLTYFGYTGFIFALLASLFGICWLILSLKGFSCHCTKSWSKQMFRLSLVIIMALSIGMTFD